MPAQRSEKPDLVVLISSFRPCLLLGGGTGLNIRVVGYGESEGATMPGLRQLAWRELGEVGAVVGFRESRRAACQWKLKALQREMKKPAPVVTGAWPAQ
jgi:hypothetical protein